MLEFNAGYYDTLRFQGHFSWGMTTYVTLELKRDSTFGVYQGIVYDEQEGVPVQDAVVTVDNRTTRTDVRGIFKIVFSLTGTDFVQVCPNRERRLSSPFTGRRVS